LELLLNLLWILLALPAYWVWQQSQCTKRQRVQSRHSLLLMACVVLLLFPIISASDDLQAMRPEVEESSSRDLRHAQGSRHADIVDASGIVALLSGPAIVSPQFACVGLTTIPVLALPATPVQLHSSGRAPPSFSLT
jgi:hypothetical protein